MKVIDLVIITYFSLLLYYTTDEIKWKETSDFFIIVLFLAATKNICFKNKRPTLKETQILNFIPILFGTEAFIRPSLLYGVTFTMLLQETDQFKVFKTEDYDCVRRPIYSVHFSLSVLSSLRIIFATTVHKYTV